MGLGLITAIYGEYDELRPLPVGHGFDDAVCITDNPNLAADGWRILVDPSTEPPRLAAKRPKFLPDDYLTTSASVWIDAAFAVCDHRFAEFAAEHLARHELVVWDHPETRDCLYQEATYCQGWPKYQWEPIPAQTAAYRAAGMPEHFGLFAAGTIGRRHTPAMRQFGDAWLRECQTWSIQDQISLPFLLWREGITVGLWEAHEFQNNLLTYHPHLRHE